MRRTATVPTSYRIHNDADDTAMEPSTQVDESKEDAARTLFDPAQVMLHALSHGLQPSAVRRRLLAHLAGAPPQKPRKRSTSPDQYDPFARMARANQAASASASVRGPGNSRNASGEVGSLPAPMNAYMTAMDATPTPLAGGGENDANAQLDSDADLPDDLGAPDAPLLNTNQAQNPHHVNTAGNAGNTGPVQQNVDQGGLETAFANTGHFELHPHAQELAQALAHAQVQAQAQTQTHAHAHGDLVDDAPMMDEMELSAASATAASNAASIRLHRLRTDPDTGPIVASIRMPVIYDD